MLKKDIYQKRKFEKVIAALFLLATLSYGFGSSGLISNLNDQQVRNIMASIESINSISVILIGNFFSKIITGKRQLLKGYLISRILEGILLITGTFLTLYFAPTNPELAIFYHDFMFNIAMLFLGIYSTYFFYKLMAFGTKWLMLLGVIGYVGLTTYSALAIIPGIETSMLLFIPGGLFEIILPLYLLFKGLE